MFRLCNWQQSPAVEGRWSVIGGLRAWSMKYRDKQLLGGEAAQESNISFLRCNSIQRFKMCSHLLPLCPTFSPAHAINPFSFYCLLCFYWGFLDAHWSRYIFLSAVICVTGTHTHVQAHAWKDTLARRCLVTPVSLLAEAAVECKHASLSNIQRRSVHTIIQCQAHSHKHNMLTITHLLLLLRTNGINLPACSAAQFQAQVCKF